MYRCTDLRKLNVLSDGSVIDSFNSFNCTSFTKSVLVLLLSNSALELVVTSGVGTSEGELIGNPLFTLKVASFEMEKVNNLSISLHEIVNRAKKAIKVKFFVYNV